MQSATQNIALAPAQPFHATITGQALLAVAGSGFVAIMAHLAVPLPFTPVPLSLVTLGVLLVGLTLSPVAAFSALAMYLLEGAAGMPVFNPGGPGGMFQLLGPTGGYLFSYPFAAATASLIVRLALGSKTVNTSSSLRFAAAALAGTVGSIFFFAAGATWLARFMHVAPAAAMTMGVLPFLPGEVVKIAAAAGIYSAGRKLARS